MPKVTRKNSMLASKFVSPTILRLLKEFSAVDLARAVHDDLDLVAELKNNGGNHLSMLRMVITGVPYSDRLAPFLKSKPWLTWFIENEMKKKRPDLYSQFVYSPDAFKWLQKNMRGLTDFLF